MLVRWATVIVRRGRPGSGSAPSGLPPGQLTSHANRGWSMPSNPVTELLSFLGIGYDTPASVYTGSPDEEITPKAS